MEENEVRACSALQQYNQMKEEYDSMKSQLLALTETQQKVSYRLVHHIPSSWLSKIVRYGGEGGGGGGVKWLYNQIRPSDSVTVVVQCLKCNKCCTWVITD